MTRYLVTSGLPYSNGRLHVGHIAGAYLPADTFCRYLRAKGHEVLYVCGSDDNGVAIEISALQAGQTPQEVCTHYHQRQRADFTALGIQFDVYGGTHQPGYQELHERFSQDFFLRIHEKGYFTKRVAKQLYDPHNQRFLPDRYVRGTCHHCRTPNATGDQCDNCGKMIDALLLIEPVSQLPPHVRAEVRETTHWYLRLDAFEKPLADWLQSKVGKWRPHVVNFAIGQVQNGLPERAMTRDISWGIPVPLPDPEARGKVLFVWFDAPIGYVSFTAQLCATRDGDPRGYERWWCDPQTRIVNFIGEDNTVFHALIWPAMLMAEGRHQLVSDLVANNFLNFKRPDAAAPDGAVKISKSQTPPDSPVWIEEYAKRFDPDALRYYLTAIAPESARTDFVPADFIARNNNELVAAFGNFVNRWPKFVHDDFAGACPAATPTDADRAHIAAAGAALGTVGALIEQYRFRAALEEFMGFARRCNEYIGTRAPWKLRKTDLADCAACIVTCWHATHYLAVMCAPLMPRAAGRIAAMLGADAALPWTAPAAPAAGAPLQQPVPLFSILDPKAMG